MNSNRVYLACLSLLFLTLGACTNSSLDSQGPAPEADVSDEPTGDAAAAEVEAVAKEAEAAVAAAEAVNLHQADTGGSSERGGSSTPSCKIPNQADSETFGLILNMNSLLCAKVVRVCGLKVENALEVTCIQYRGGSATKTYIVDVATASAFEQ